MRESKRRFEWKRGIKKVRQLLKREIGVLLIWGAILMGAINFLVIVDSGWYALPNHWWWLVIAVATLSLPGTFRKLKGNKEPLLVRFSLAFRAGFLAISQLVPDLASWKKKLLTFGK